MLNKPITPLEKRRFTVTRRQGRSASTVLMNLLYDTSAPALAFLAEHYGLRRMPGLSHQGIVARILRHLSTSDLERLEDDLIAARYGGLSIEHLVHLALVRDVQRSNRPAPRLDQISPDEAVLVEGEPSWWFYTMRGHDVKIDLARNALECDCPYFAFAARRGALCKHLALAFTLIPEAYAREALIELLIWREYSGGEAPRWLFKSTHREQPAHVVDHP